jgi:hypothetical protein
MTGLELSLQVFVIIVACDGCGDLDIGGVLLLLVDAVASAVPLEFVLWV